MHETRYKVAVLQVAWKGTTNLLLPCKGRMTNELSSIFEYKLMN